MIKSYPVKTIPELLPILKQFNPKLTESSIAGRAFKLSLHKTAEFKTEKGRYGRSLQGPNPNKGNKNFRIANSEHTRFKKGSTPLNTLYDGAIVTRIYHRNKREYKWIRLNGKWHMLHVVRYEETYGPVPDGKIVVFKDGNPLNVHISNLECISLAENMLRNTIHRFPPELKEIIHLTTRVKRKIKKLTKNG